MSTRIHQLQWRSATPKDARLLAELNHQLIQDEGHRNSMGVEELEQRMLAWLASEYRAVLFQRDSNIVAYALYRIDERDRIHLGAVPKLVIENKVKSIT